MQAENIADYNHLRATTEGFYVAVGGQIHRWNREIAKRLYIKATGKKLPEELERYLERKLSDYFYRRRFLPIGYTKPDLPIEPVMRKPDGQAREIITRGAWNVVLFPFEESGGHGILLYRNGLKQAHRIMDVRDGSIKVAADMTKQYKGIAPNLFYHTKFLANLLKAPRIARFLPLEEGYEELLDHPQTDWRSHFL